MFKITLLVPMLAALLMVSGIARGEDLDGPVPADICRQLADILNKTPGAQTIDSQGEFRDDLKDTLRPGCRVTLHGSLAALEENPLPTEILRLENSTIFKNWTADYSYAADGPDGTMFAGRKKNTLCIVTGHWDGGDDSDPDYVPADWYEVKITCFSGIMDGI